MFKILQVSPLMLTPETTRDVLWETPALFSLWLFSLSFWGSIFGRGQVFGRYLKHLEPPPLWPWVQTGEPWAKTRVPPTATAARSPVSHSRHRSLARPAARGPGALEGCALTTGGLGSAGTWRTRRRDRQAQVLDLSKLDMVGAKLDVGFLHGYVICSIHFNWHIPLE